MYSIILSSDVLIRFWKQYSTYCKSAPLPVRVFSRNSPYLSRNKHPNFLPCHQETIARIIDSIIEQHSFSINITINWALLQQLYFDMLGTAVSSKLIHAATVWRRYWNRNRTTHKHTQHSNNFGIAMHIAYLLYCLHTPINANDVSIPYCRFLVFEFLLRNYL